MSESKALAVKEGERMPMGQMVQCEYRFPIFHLVNLYDTILLRLLSFSSL